MVALVWGCSTQSTGGTCNDAWNKGATACPRAPSTTKDQFLQQCNNPQGFTGCVSQASALSDCVKKATSYTCDSNGQPQPVGCDNQAFDLSACLFGQFGLDGGAPEDTGAADAMPDSISVAEAAVSDVEASVPDAEAAVDAPSLDAGTLPDAAGLSGLRIGFFGDVGLRPETTLVAFLVNVATVTRVHTTAQPGGPLTATDLAKFDVVILDQLVRTYTAAEAQVLADWVAGGGGLFSMTGYTGGGDDAARPNSLLAAMGLQYGAFLGGTSDVVPSVSHPVTQGVAQLLFSGGYEVIVSAYDGGSSAPDGGVDTILAKLDATHNALIAQEATSGRALVWGDEWIEYDSEFAGNASDRRFWVNAIGWLAHR
jgi:hypothetical protein